MWLTGGALAIAVVMIIGLLGLVFNKGIGTFWPKPLLELKLANGKTVLGEIARQESYWPDPSLLAGLPPESAEQAKREMAAENGWATRRLVRVGNFEITHASFQWIDDFRIVSTTRPTWALSIERLEKGRFYGDLEALLIDGKVVDGNARGSVAEVRRNPSRGPLALAAKRVAQKIRERVRTARERSARLAQIQAELDHGLDSPQYAAAVNAYKATETWGRMRTAEISTEVNRLTAENARYKLRVKPVQGAPVDIPLENIVRAYPANQLGLWGKLRRLWLAMARILARTIRAKRTAPAAIFPAIWGTIAMTFIMTLMVVPFGVLAALYLANMPKPDRSPAPCGSRSTIWPACRASCSERSAWDSFVTEWESTSTAARKIPGPRPPGFSDWPPWRSWAWRPFSWAWRARRTAARPAIRWQTKSPPGFALVLAGVAGRGRGAGCEDAIFPRLLPRRLGR